MRDSIRILEDKGCWSLVTKGHVMPDASSDTGSEIVKHARISTAGRKLTL